MESNSNARANPALRAWAADWGNALSVVLGVYAVIYLGIMSVARDATWSHVLRAVAFVPMNSGAAVLALRASRRTDTDPRIRRALFFIGLAFTSVLLGNLTPLLVFMGNGNPLSAWTNILYFGLYVLGLAGGIAFPPARRVSD